MLWQTYLIAANITNMYFLHFNFMKKKTNEIDDTKNIFHITSYVKLAVIMLNIYATETVITVSINKRWFIPAATRNRIYW